ncbi:hypothetical protein BGW42_007856 [Actinomortierella wolfii]|nr:hypothetical protein BGW42_007856 [Actinomortierella wolfii]
MDSASDARPQVVLAPLPSRENSHHQNAVDYDLYESDYTKPSPVTSQPPAASSSSGWNFFSRKKETPTADPAPTPASPTTVDTPISTGDSRSNSTHGNPTDSGATASSTAVNSNSDYDDTIKVEFDLAALKLDGPSDSLDPAFNENGETVFHEGEVTYSSPIQLNSQPFRYSDPEARKPAERNGYVDDSRFSGSDQASAVGSPSLANHEAAFAPGHDIHSPPETAPKRIQSTDSDHSAIRAYAAGGAPTPTYSDSPASGHVRPPPPHQGGYYGPPGAGAPGGPPGGGYGGGYQYPPHHRPPPPQRPTYGGAPGQYGGQYDPRYQQYPGSGAPGGGYGPGYPPHGGYPDQYDQYGQGYYGQPQQQHYGGGGGGGYDYGGYPPHHQGYGPPAGGPPGGYYGHGSGRGGANLNPSPSIRGPHPGMGRGGPGGPRPPMGPPGEYGARPPHRGDSSSSMGGGGGAPGGGGQRPPQRKRQLTVEVLDQMRQHARNSGDPAAQLDYAKALIEAAMTFGNDDPDPKRQKKNKEALFMEGLKIIKRLATAGMGIGKPAYPEAMFFLANCYGHGSLGLQIDHDKAFNLYMQASKQNHPASTYRTAVCYELGAGTKRDHSRAVQFYRKAASLGDTQAMYKLGMIMLKGLLGQQPNPREAITWLKRAAANADEENPHALHELGLCFEKQCIPSVIPDEAYARELFTQAAGFGYAPSQYKLGHCYEYGALTCPVDPRRSIAWYTRAAEQGDAESELGLSGWYLTGSEGVLKQSDTEAYLWARRAADKGLARAEYAVGYYSEVGIGVKQDLEEARRWYLRAAAQGNARAKKRLTEMKKMGAMRRIQPQRGRAPGQGPDGGEDCKVM